VIYEFIDSYTISLVETDLTIPTMKEHLRRYRTEFDPAEHDIETFCEYLQSQGIQARLLNSDFTLLF